MKKIIITGLWCLAVFTAQAQITRITEKNIIKFKFNTGPQRYFYAKIDPLTKR
ncbi:hypothetical protein [Pedobacter sp. BS3]|uniref:hypothetical protein n=1 Tax=Pedobacter sp. BS3 TaxID=2567937 RepID=UPI0016590C70|nr:hypothetical protein [Pedobacter sp. BS3]